MKLHFPFRGCLLCLSGIILLGLTEIHLKKFTAGALLERKTGEIKRNSVFSERL